MKKGQINIPIYQAVVSVSIDKDLKSVQKEYKTKPLDNFGAVTFRDKKKYRHYVVGFEYFSGSIIVHEVVHLVNMIYKDCGIELDIKNDENQAYFSAWLFDEIEKIIK